ncbi:MAG: phosphatase PAP2 family protein, partial [bacterium]
AMTIADAVIAVFDSKYTYWVKRPFMMDRSIRTVMPTPNHPSYPAGHSTLSAAAATILSHYFPEATDTWQALAREAGLSRVWGGIHFPMDNEQGLILGDRVAREAIRQLQMTRSKSE